MLGVFSMTWNTYSEYLAELAKHKPWQKDPLVEEQRRQVELERAKGQKFYVYVVRDPRPGKNFCPIYVGKGYGRRAFVTLGHKRIGALPHIITKCRKLGLTPPVEI